MTCIIGLEYDGKVYVGGDSASASGWTVRKTAIEKVFKKDAFIIGYTTSFRMGQILQYMIDYPKSDVYDEQYMVTQFIEVVRLRFKELGYTKIENNQEEGGEFIVGVNGKIYTISDDYQVNRKIDGVSAVGCGAQYALGAMKAYDLLLPKERIIKSMEIAEYFSGAVSSPFIVLQGV